MAIYVWDGSAYQRLSQVFKLQSSIIGTSYGEVLKFFVPAGASKVELRVIGYKPNEYAFRHSHGSHKHNAAVEEEVNARSFTNEATVASDPGGYNPYLLTSTSVGSGNSAVSATYPNGLYARINGSHEHGPWGNGSADVDSGWIDITSEVNKGDVNTLQFKASSAGCKAIAMIRITY